MMDPTIVTMLANELLSEFYFDSLYSLYTYDDAPIRQNDLCC